MSYNTNDTARGASISGQEGDIITPPSKIGHRAPRTISALKALNTRAAYLRDRLIAKVETWTLHG